MARSLFSPATFQPHRLVRGGHAQTLCGFWLPSVVYPYRAAQQVVELEDGDRLVLHEDVPERWSSGGPVALLVHGLAGCHLSGYMQRIAARLVEQGVRVLRLDQRGCGASFPLTRHLPHSGRAGDVAAALRWIAQALPGSPVALVGFSLGGNLVLNALAERDAAALDAVALAIAVCPPIDLVACSRHVERGRSRIYGSYFVRLLMRHLAQRQRQRPELPPIPLARQPRTLWEFDHLVTAPLSGFESAEHYYRRSSPGPKLKSINLPTLIVAAADDPLVPIAPFAEFERSPAVELLRTTSGGHLGFLAAPSGDADRRWLDWRIVQWIVQGLGK